MLYVAVCRLLLFCLLHDVSILGLELGDRDYPPLCDTATMLIKPQRQSPSLLLFPAPMVVLSKLEHCSTQNYMPFPKRLEQVRLYGFCRNHAVRRLHLCSSNDAAIDLLSARHSEPQQVLMFELSLRHAGNHAQKLLPAHPTSVTHVLHFAQRKTLDATQ